MKAGAQAHSDETRVPRVYLKLHRKREREGFVEDAPESRYVRVQWSSAEMGLPPAQLQRALATRTKLLFRRLPDPSTRAVPPPPPTRSALTPAARAEVRAPAITHVGPSRTHVERVTQAEGCLLIECASELTGDAAASAASVTLYVLDTQASEREAMEDAFGEFAITDSVDADGGGSFLKRRRDPTDDVADLTLAPVRRLSSHHDHSGGAIQGAEPPRDSQWGVVEDDVEGTTREMLMAYDAMLCVESAGETAADLYCYPDHRKDDEYDSNAEDFSGNDYPNDADDGMESAASHDGDDGTESSTGRRGRRGRDHEAYGMFCEEGYSERSLSSGWGSDDAC